MECQDVYYDRGFCIDDIHDSSSKLFIPSFIPIVIIHGKSFVINNRWSYVILKIYIYIYFTLLQRWVNGRSYSRDSYFKEIQRTQNKTNIFFSAITLQNSGVKKKRERKQREDVKGWKWLLANVTRWYFKVLICN